MSKRLKTWIDENNQRIVSLMIVAIVWESIEIGWDDPQKLVARVFAITVFGTIIGIIIGFLWRHSHFKKWL